MIIVDSSIWISYFNGVQSSHTNLLDNILGQDLVGIGDLILTEVLQGFRIDKDYEIAKRLLLALPVYDFTGTDIAIKSAENYRRLREQGITVRKTIDVIIATFCIENDLPLLHADRDFQYFSEHLNLKVIEVS